MSRADDRQAVLEHLRKHGPSTVRAVAADVFGCGRTRTPERNRAYDALRALEAEGVVARTRPPGPYDVGVGDRWALTQV